MKIHLFEAGHCYQGRHLALQGEPVVKEVFPSLAACIEHPEACILFDTGYSDLFFQETKSFPFSLYAKLTPVEITEAQTLRAQLFRKGILPEQIQWIVLSHFHADHIAACRHYPKARFIVSREAAVDFQKSRGLSRLTSAYLPGLLPADFWERCVWIEDIGRRVPGSVWNRGLAWLTDTRIQVVPLPGHAAGHLGLWVDPDLFLLGDACWLRESFESNRIPSLMTKPLVWNWDQMTQTIADLHEFHRLHPKVRLIPSHCRKSHVLAQREQVGI